MKSTKLKLMIATTIGSIFEIFDFIAFVFLSPILIEVFFPHNIESRVRWFTYLTISISYLLRPIGGMILGHLGDKYGRKSVFSISILLMSLPSLCIAFLPTYAAIGYTATALLIIMRLLQGFSVGGEVPGAITYIAEKFKNTNSFVACAWLTFGANLAVAIGSLSIKALIEYTSKDFMYTYGWRIPFLLGSILTIIGFYIRKSMSESSEFEKTQKVKMPFFELLHNYFPSVISGIILAIVVSLATSIFHVFLPNLFVSYFHFNLDQMNGVSAAGALTLAIMSLLFAYITRYIHPITIIRVSLITLCLIYTAIYFNIILLAKISLLYIWIVLISFCLAGINGLFFAILANLFPTRVRYSGIAICYNIAYIFGAGLTPIWTNLVLEINHNYNAIILVCIFFTIISLLNTINLKKLTNQASLK